MKQIIYIFILSFAVMACNSETQSSKKVDVEEETSLDEKIMISKIGVVFSEDAKEKVANWQDFTLMSDKLKRYYRVNKTEALYNAPALVEIIEAAADTIEVDMLDRSDVRIRFNVIKNHALRLSDMSSINSIEEDEVLAEVTSMLDAYSALKDKINTVCKIEAYRKELGIIYQEKKEEPEAPKETHEIQRPRKSIFGMGHSADPVEFQKPIDSSNSE